MKRTRNELLPGDVMDWVRVPPEKQGSVVLGTADMQQAVADADLTMGCYDHQQRDTVLGLMVGQLTDGVLCITGVQILLEANVIAVVKHFLKRLSAHRRVRGVVVFVQEADLPNCCLKIIASVCLHSVLSRLGFVEADIRRDRYNKQQLCYSPVYRFECPQREQRRMSLILSDTD